MLAIIERKIGYLQRSKGQGASLVVQQLRLRAANAEGTGSIPGQGTKFPHAHVAWPKHLKKKERTEYPQTH